MVITRKFRRALQHLVRDMNRDRIDYLAKRLKLRSLIADHAENGQVAIVHGGIDCDGGRWDNRVALVTATVVAVERWIDRYHAQAEGPQWQTIARPSEVADLEEDSRDLALEAFEDGHGHILYA